MSKSQHWNAFLPIGGTLTSNELGLDPRWAAAMGVDQNALAVLRVIRRVVLPIVRDLERRGVLRAFSFLIHDRASGVPCPPEDSRAYVHLRVMCYPSISGKRLRLGAADENVRGALKGWSYVSKVQPTKEELKVQEVLYAQSAWYLRFLEERANVPDAVLLQDVAQALHHFANMSQMMVR